MKMEEQASINEQTKPDIVEHYEIVYDDHEARQFIEGKNEVQTTNENELIVF